MKKAMFAGAISAAMIFASGIFAAEDAKKAEAVKKADTDADGKVTVVEYAAYCGCEETAKKADKNADGIIVVDEFVIATPAKAEKK
jgi:hypothetical protein